MPSNVPDTANFPSADKDLSPSSQLGDAVRQKLMDQGICEEDIAAAVAWAKDHSNDQS